MAIKSVQFVNAAQRAAGPQPADDGADHRDGWRPSVWIGAPAVGGLALPAAQPTASWLYAPRGVHLGDDLLVVADTGNHRVLIWHGMPTTDEQPCDVVLGQPDATSEGAGAGRGDTRRGMYLPTGVLVHDGALIVADAWHHRVLIYAAVPTTGWVEPDVVLGQADLDSVQPNRGGDCTLDSLYWPFGVAVVGGRFYVADTGNRRVLGWDGVPVSNRPPDVVLGQSDAIGRGENRDGPAGPASFRWPHDMAGTDDLLLVADAGNHRVLGWTPQPSEDGDADLVLGQTDYVSATEWPYAPQRPDTLRFPYAVDVDTDPATGTPRLAVADTANNRILLWPALPAAGDLGLDAAAVLGQPKFSANGENRWQSVERDTLCWPYGLSLRGDTLAVADSGNNRVMIWTREAPE